MLHTPFLEKVPYSPIIQMILGHHWCGSPASLKGCSDTFRSWPQSDVARRDTWGPEALFFGTFTWIFLASQRIGFGLFHPNSLPSDYDVISWVFLQFCAGNMQFSCGTPWQFAPWAMTGRSSVMHPAQELALSDVCCFPNGFYLDPPSRFATKGNTRMNAPCIFDKMQNHVMGFVIKRWQQAGGMTAWRHDGGTPSSE